MNEEKTMLEVGDVVYGRRYRTVESRHKIDRVTKTQAFSGDTKFKINIEGGYVREIGASGFNSKSYHLETPELKIEYLRTVNLNKIRNTDFSTLSDTKLQQIINILNS